MLLEQSLNDLSDDLFHRGSENPDKSEGCEGLRRYGDHQHFGYGDNPHPSNDVDAADVIDNRGRVWAADHIPRRRICRLNPLPVERIAQTPRHLTITPKSTSASFYESGRKESEREEHNENRHQNKRNDWPFEGVKSFTEKGNLISKLTREH